METLREWHLTVSAPGERSPIPGAYRASGLNLLVAAVIMWNTQYLQLAAAELGVKPEMMRRVAPIGWEHLSLPGDYAWDEGQLAPGELRPLRTKASLLAA